ncbi:MAG: recombinase family protein [Stellaceae bacterium]
MSCVDRAIQAERAEVFVANVMPVIDGVRAAGVVTLKGIADALNARGVRTFRGGRWGPTLVRRILLRRP